MRYTNNQLNDIYDRTTGYCHICRKKLAFINYGRVGSRGAWEVEHSRAKAHGGTDRGNNLYPACISCNRSKGEGNTRTARKQHGHTRAPLSKEKRKNEKIKNAVAGGGLGAIIGSVFGPVGTIAGSIIGASVAHKKNPDS